MKHLTLLNEGHREPVEGKPVTCCTLREEEFCGIKELACDCDPGEIGYCR